MIEIVSATRLPQTEFWKNSPLAKSLIRISRDARLSPPQVAFENRAGLAEIFNARIASSQAEILVFVHDDAWIEDYYLCDRVIEGLNAYDIIGIVGNRRRVDRQPSWCYLDFTSKWDDPANLSGSVAHGRPPAAPVSIYGPAPAECELLDGVFLAGRRKTLASNGVLFDPAFAFHFYDMDFCRRARAMGLRLSTWPICITHESGGDFDRQNWGEAYERYIKKWGD